MEAISQLLDELKAQSFFKPGQICVVGCSTSEVLGARIGTQGSMDVAETLYTALMRIHKETGTHFVFQGCEHINRAITLERDVFDDYRMEMVDVVPDTHAGGSLATYAYRQMTSPVVVEHIQADCGIDIGQTLIGMHIKHVAVPVRTKVKTVGDAIVTIATSRPKKIGGERAKYN